MLEYHPRNGYVNDFTVVEKGGVYHLFHIVGPRYKMSPALTDLPRQGHAVSRDFLHWRELAPVTSMGGACSCVKCGDRYGLVENVHRVCWSKDLCRWSDPEPMHFDFARHAKVYETVWNMEESRYNSHRDPNIRWDPEKKVFVLFFCSRVSYGEPFTRGCVGAAESIDLVHWKLLPPALGPGEHLFPESPHVFDLNGKHHMIFTLSPENGLRHAVSENLRGPYREVENFDLLPAYVTASETVKTQDGWIFMGRMQDRNERCNQARLASRALCLPLRIEARDDDRMSFSALPALQRLRGGCVYDSAKHRAEDHWHVESGDWRINRSSALAANRHQGIPKNSLFGSSNVTPARVFLRQPVADFDMEFDLQLPSFNGNDAQYRAGFMVDGVRFLMDALLKAVVCQDPSGDVLAHRNVSLFKCDRYDHYRVFRCDGITQLYLNSELIMYLPAYGDAGHRIGFFVDHNDVIVKDLRIWKLRTPVQSGFSMDDPKGDTMNGIHF